MNDEMKKALPRQGKRRTAALVTLPASAAFLLLLSAGCQLLDSLYPSEVTAPAGSGIEEIQERGVLKVGTAGDYRPMSFLDPETGSYTGFDAELSEDLAASLGVGLEYVETSWPSLMEDTLAGKFDLAICGITVTDARKDRALMSEGYLENGKTLLCRAEDAGKYASLEAINRPGVRVMENPGGTNEQFARENLPDALLMIHDVNQEIPGLIASGEADVMITEVAEAGYYAGQDSRLAAPLIHEPFTQGELGVLMPKGSDDLLNYVNAFLDEEKRTGRIDELYEKYISGKEDAPEAAAYAGLIFDSIRIHTIQISMSEKDKADQLANPKDKTKYRVDAVVDGEEFKDVAFPISRHSLRHNVLDGIFPTFNACDNMRASGTAWSVPCMKTST
jgi:ABC-type amino acid transport substrate-binding protein